MNVHSRHIKYLYQYCDCTYATSWSFIRCFVRLGSALEAAQHVSKGTQAPPDVSCGRCCL